MSLRLDSASIFDALREQIADWPLAGHEFDPRSDEVKISYDVGGSGRVAVTVGFELDRAAMAALLHTARPAE